MGMTPKKDSNRVYLSCSKGSFVRRATEDTPGAIMRTSTAKGYEGKKYYELLYDNVDGFLINVEYKKTEFGPQYEFTLDDDGQQIMLQMRAGFSDTRAILESLQELKMGKKVRFTPWYNQSSQKSGMIVEELYGVKWERVHNHYKKFEKKGDKWELVSQLSEYPSGKIDWTNDLEIKEYSLKVDKLLYNDTKTWIEMKLRPFLLEQEAINARLATPKREDVIKPNDSYDHIPEESRVTIEPNDQLENLPF